MQRLLSFLLLFLVLAVGASAQAPAKQVSANPNTGALTWPTASTFRSANSIQPLDNDLTALAALNTDTFGRGVLELADDAEGRSYFGATAGVWGVALGGTGTSTAFTAGSILFSGASGVYSQDNASLFFDDSNNRLGVGTASPASVFHLRAPSTGGANQTTVFTIESQDSGADSGSLISFRNSASTSLAQIGGVDVSGVGGAYVIKTKVADGNGATAPAERLRVGADGHVGVGTSGAGLARLHVQVAGTSTTMVEAARLSTSSFVGDDGGLYQSFFQSGDGYEMARIGAIGRPGGKSAIVFHSVTSSLAETARIDSDGALEVQRIEIGAGTPITKVLSATATLNFGNIAEGSVEALTITVTGAAVGDAVFLGLPSTAETALTYTPFVSATDTVTVVAAGVASGSGVDPASGTYRAVVVKF